MNNYIESIKNIKNKIPPTRFIYDNEVTLLYKWADFFDVPISYMVVKPREETDDNPVGNEKYVFEPLPYIIDTLSSQEYQPADMFDYIHKYNKQITNEDIMIIYYENWKNTLPEEELSNLYVYVKDLYQSLKAPAVDIENDKDAENKYQIEKSKAEKNRDIDFQRLADIEDVQEQLSIQMNKEKIAFGPLTVNTSTIGFHPTLNNKPVTTKDGLDIFNKAIPSKYVPFIKYNDEYGKSYYRVYTGAKLENEPNYSVIVIPQSSSSHKNALYLTLWLGDPENTGTVDLNKAPKESFYTVIYELSSNFLTIKIPVFSSEEQESTKKKNLVTDDKIAYNRTQDALPTIVFGAGEEIKVGGEFNIYGLDFDESSFLDMVLTDSVLNVYLYVEENIKPFALKKRLDVHYRSIFTDQAEGKTESEKSYIENSASVSLTLNEKILSQGDTINVYDENGTLTTIKNEEDLKYIHVNVSQADSTVELHEFMSIFQLLLGYYRDYKGDILKQYFNVIPQLHQLQNLLFDKKKKISTTEFEIPKTRKTKKSEKLHKKLQEKAPDIFVNGYPRLCQSKSQPEPIEPEDIDSWKKSHRVKGMPERQVMPFPKEENRIFLGCPNDEKPYPGVKRNTTLENKEIYPYVPCCGSKDQMSPNIQSKYNDYLKSDARVNEVGAKAESKISVNRILTPGKIGYLPKAVENLVKKYSFSQIDMVRYGIIHSPNSFLHCICEAVDDPNYVSLKSDALKEQYVIRLRKYIKNNINAGLLKQELYDYDDNAILNSLDDINSFFDPSVYYRAIEEIFNINIYVFLTPQSGDESSLGSLDIPRSKIFHTRPIRLYRRTVTILKSFGSKSDNLSYPQCELIMDYDKENSSALKIFGPEMTQLCHDALINIYQTTTWSAKSNDNSFQINHNIYYHVDHVSLFKVPIIAQFIDNNGKMRALTLNSNGKLLTIATIPSQPENIPNIQNINMRSSIEDVRQILGISLGNPMAVSKNSKDEIDGVWFRLLDIEYAEYVPINPVDNDLFLKNLPVGPKNPIFSTETPVTSRLNKLRRTLKIIVQLVKYLYEFVRVNESYDIKTFVAKYLVYEKDQVDSLDYYDLKNIQRKLPIDQTIDKALNTLSLQAPTLFSDGKIIMYNIKFGDRIYKLLEDYGNANNGMPQKIIEYIDGFFETEDDFDKVNFSKIFVGDEDFNAWLSSLKSSLNYSKFFNINDKIDVNSSFSTDPYLYRDNAGKIYIIQNVVGGKKQKAMNVAYNWFVNKINIGPDAAPINEEFPHIIYGISTSSSTLTAIEDATNETDENYLNLIYYGTASDKNSGRENKYGAMLELL